ncbi:hypothetical protein [Methylobacterium iners]|uniref:Phage tail protein n=1 Tax=Methylobacterium iners TaxID=418707 RepID=A0ABQ4S6H0_9HYPH|nr:hypothetical protein [Methylobacterium iners]GJD97484.1 hypothetical protein OCOJLMKI_4715 [Methylobacterium iners]
MSIQHLVWLEDALDPITDADLATAMEEGNDQILSGTLTRERGALPALEVEMAHPGWGILAPGQRRGVALVVSDDGTMATATVRARGYVRAMPSALTGDTLTLQFECSPEDWEERRDAAARAVLAASQGGLWQADGGRRDPSRRGDATVDFLFGRSQHIVDDLLASTSAFIRHDPVSHEVTLVDVATSARVHNLGDGYDPTSLSVTEGEGAVEQVKWTLFANIQQTASGVCDIASRMPALSSLLGYTVGGNTDMSANIGWSLDQPQIQQVYSAGTPAETGRVWRVESRRIYYIQVPNPNGAGTVTATTYTSTRTTDYHEYQRRQVQTTYFRSWPARFNYNQTRREKVVLTLDVPVQRVGGIRRVLDLGETTLRDLYRPDTTDEDAEILVEGDTAENGFAEGTYAFLAGKLFQAVRDTTEQPYSTRLTRQLDAVVELSDDWVDTGLSAPMPDRSAASFFDTERGKALIAHALLRMRRAALGRLVSWQVTLTCNRDDLPSVDLEDQVRFLLPARWDQPAKECVGRVHKIVEKWSGADGETVTLTLGVPLGTGVEAFARQAVIDRYGGDAYFGVETPFLERGTEFLSAGDDVEFVVTADPLVQHYAPQYLTWHAYAVRDILVRGSAVEQEADFARAAAQGIAPSAQVTRQTQIDVKLLPLISERLIEREIRVQGTLLRSPRGIDLTQAA